MLKLRREKKEVSINMRSARTCCVELAMSNPSGPFSDLDQVKGFISSIDKSLISIDEASSDEQFVEAIREFSTTTMTQIAKVYEKGHEDFVSRASADLVSAIAASAEHVLSTVVDRQKLKFDSSKNLLVESLNEGSDSDVRQLVSRLFLTICKKEEVTGFFNFTIENRARVLSSFFTLKHCITTLSGHFERICPPAVIVAAPQLKAAAATSTSSSSAAIKEEPAQDTTVNKQEEAGDTALQEGRLKKQVAELEARIVEITNERDECSNDRDKNMSDLEASMVRSFELEADIQQKDSLLRELQIRYEQCQKELLELQMSNAEQKMELEMLRKELQENQNLLQKAADKQSSSPVKLIFTSLVVGAFSCFMFYLVRQKH